MEPRHRAAIPITVIAMLLGFMLTVQISSLTGKSSGSSTQDYLTTLTQANEQQQENDLLNTQIAQTKAQLATYQSSGDTVKERREALLKDQANAEAAAGIAPMSGAGLVITLSADQSLPGYSQNIKFFDPQIVLAYLVNLLYSQGAAGISIQGAAGEQQRLVTTSYIRDITQTTIGGESYFSSVEVDQLTIPAPFTIRAVGNASNMQAILTAEDFTQEMQNFGMDCIVTPSNSIKLAGYDGVMPGTYAKEVNTQ